MNTTELIRKKREGKSLTGEEINYLISSYTKKNIPDYQFSAFLMAVYLKGMNKKETAALTKAMLFSGKVINLDSIPGSKIDKHSTGGVGDKTSLILAPIVAAAGVNVPMISGRGLGHSGGTLDKLESIPGFRTDLSLTRYKQVIKKCSAVLVGQTKDVAPADKLIYALRDVTATVESIPLITASIMSKKLAEGIDGLVLDVKTGSGAFMKKTSDAVELANSLINTADAFNKKVIAFITDMNQPLGRYVGNWLEVYESINVLKGEQEDDLFELSTLLSGAMIWLGGKASYIDEGIEISKQLIKNGNAFDKFLEIVKLQQGDISFLKNPNKYPKSKVVEYIYAEKGGYISKMDNFQIGLSALELGAGRKTKDDIIETKAGLIFNYKIGDVVKKGDLLVELRSESKQKIELVKNSLNKAVIISNKKSTKPNLIKKILK
ncbi:MAG: thymidine phosphorylase [Ignavibacteriales bacterium CG_4_9_14_3_um_filter_30_11]|nr:MAG: thymidine phosphorylase [Ignavibacteriales bacterium CG_4_9_14_3_um_filter_30_11]